MKPDYAIHWRAYSSEEDEDKIVTKYKIVNGEDARNLFLAHIQAKDPLAYSIELPMGYPKGWGPAIDTTCGE